MAFPRFPSLLLLLISVLAFAESGSVGVNYGRVADNLPSPEKVVQLLKSHGITKVKMYDTDAAVLTALANSGISVVVALPNELLSAAAADQTFADEWIKANVTKYYPATKIEAIAVGNEVFVDPNNTTEFLVPAMTNIYNSLVKNKIDSNISVSSPIALSALQTSYPTSAGSFKPDLVNSAVKPMLELLRKSGSYLMVNAYPFFAYEANTDTISLDYALFKENAGVVDSGNGLKYTSLFDAQVDAVYAAMSALQYNDVRIVVTETGWPSKGDENEAGAGAENAAAYNGNLVKRVLTGGGTPLKPDTDIDVFLFALFNEDQKSGPTSERNYGLFYPDQEKVYSIPLTISDIANGQSAVVNGSKSSIAPGPAPTANKPAPSGSGSGQTWCVANSKAGVKKIQAALDYACGEGKADCAPIQKGAPCYDPNSVEAHASYALNSYYQKQGRVAGSCSFGGAGYVVTQAPQYGSCVFPSGY